MSLLVATVFTTVFAASPLAQGELVKFVSGYTGRGSGCGVIHWFAQFEAQRINGDTVTLYLSCPEMAPTVPKVGDVCRVTYTLGPIEAVIPRDEDLPHHQPEGDEMIIEHLECGPHHQQYWDTIRSSPR